MGKVFISYSHDSPEHSERVLALSNRLRALGVDTELDRYHVRPPQGWPHWCEVQLRPESSSFALVICTQTYRARVENQVGADEGRGVYWEGTILYNYLYNAKGNSRFIPVLLDETPEEAIPLPLDGHTRYRIRAFEFADSGFEALYRELTGQPETPKPDLGEVIRLGVGGSPRAVKALPEKEAVTDFAPVGRPLDESAAREPIPSGVDSAQTAAPRGTFWSPFSNEKSVERGEVRLLAIVETLAAMAVFWWVAIHYRSFLLLTTSLFVAPLLLLRSDESTRLAVKWLDKGMFALRWPDDFSWIQEAERRRERRLWLWIVSAIVCAVMLGLHYSVAKLYLAGHEGWSAFGRGIGVGLTISSLVAAAAQAALIVMAGAAAVTEVVPVGSWLLPAGIAGAALLAPVAMVNAAMSVAVWGALAVALAGAGVAALAGVVVGAAVAAAMAMGVFLPRGLPLLKTELIDFLATPPSTLLGIWLATLTFRFAATARHAQDGYRRLPTNLQRLALCMTPLQQPELIPGLQASNPLRFEVYFRFHRIFSGFPRLGRFELFSFLALFIYLPAWAYRFILKSTLWCWWILFIVGGAPRLDGGIEGLRADAYRKAWAWVGIATTFFAVVGFGFGWLLKPWAENLAAEAKLPTAVALLVLVDWKSIPIVQWTTLAAALTTLVALFWTQAVYVDSRNPQRAPRVAAQLPWLGHLVKWKTGFGGIGIALLMLYFALYANAVHHYVPVSDWAAGWLRWLYGDAAEPLRSA